MTSRTRVALIGAVTRSLPPIRKAFDAHWPEADLQSIVDEALETDRADPAFADADFEERLGRLIDYAVSTGAHAVQFTCSAFASEIGRLKTRFEVPVFRPDEALFKAALAHGEPVRLLLTFGPARASAEAQLSEIAASGAILPSVKIDMLDRALDAAISGDTATHDEMIAEAIIAAPENVVALGQYSMTRAASLGGWANDKVVLTGPDQAVLHLKGKVGNV